MGRIELIRKSAGLDRRILAVRARPWAWRTHFLAKKYATLAALRKGPTRFEIPPLFLSVRDISGLGSLQSSIVDFYDDVVATDVLPARPTIVDVGANIGQFVNAAKLFYPQARVICFEPDPDTFADLRANTESWADVEVQNVGLGEHTETMTFYRHRLSLMSSFSNTAENETNVGTVELPVRRLDDVVNSTIQPDLLKIDVEGFERQVLGGGWETLRRSRYLLIELSLGRAAGAENLHLLRDVLEHVPGASVLRFGRPLGEQRHPLCQDVLIEVGRESAEARPRAKETEDGPRRDLAGR